MSLNQSQHVRPSNHAAASSLSSNSASNSSIYSGGGKTLNRMQNDSVNEFNSNNNNNSNTKNPSGLFGSGSHAISHSLSQQQQPHHQAGPHSEFRSSNATINLNNNNKLASSSVSSSNPHLSQHRSTNFNNNTNSNSHNSSSTKRKLEDIIEYNPNEYSSQNSKSRFFYRFFHLQTGEEFNRSN